jgi:gas vesicle protein
MNKFMGFMAGAVCGALVGGITGLLFAPMSGQELVQSAEERWEMTMSEARRAMEERRRELETQYRINKES